MIDDTCENLSSIEEEFGCDVAKLVAGVSRLSYINQVHFKMDSGLCSYVFLVKY